MASFCKPQHLGFMLLILLFFIFTTSSLSSARLLNDFRSDGLPAAETTLELDLALAAVESEQGPKPCDHHMISMTMPHVGILRSPTQRLAGKYGPMILSKLPKGVPVPPSAPSKGINNIGN